MQSDYSLRSLIGGGVLASLQLTTGLASIVCKVDIKKYTALFWMQEIFISNRAKSDRNQNLINLAASTVGF